MDSLLNDLIIRKAKKNDFAAIVELAVQLYKTEQPFDNNIKDGYYHTDKGKSELLKKIRSRKTIFLVATINNNIVGYITGYIYERDEVYINKVAYLDQICVDINYKSKGIGTRLIDEFSNVVKKKKVKYIKLNAFEKNTPAVNLYNKMGFNEYSIFYIKKLD